MPPKTVRRPKKTICPPPNATGPPRKTDIPRKTTYRPHQSSLPPQGNETPFPKNDRPSGINDMASTHDGMGTCRSRPRSHAMCPPMRAPQRRARAGGHARKTPFKRHTPYLHPLVYPYMAIRASASCTLSSNDPAACLICPITPSVAIRLRIIPTNPPFIQYIQSLIK